jgi:leucine dehydrogenase
MQLLEEIKQKSPVEILNKLRKLSTDLVFESIPVKGYELILKITHLKTHLQSIIAIHNTTLGPALGGTRIYPYANFDDALNDVLRLSKGMTYKAALAGVGLGGGKSVIICDPKNKNTELLQSFGKAVNTLQGAYICAEDSGCNLQDIKIIRTKTPYVVGQNVDPSPFTSWGIFLGIQATVEKIYGSKNLSGKKIAIQGLGNVGRELADFLFWAGAELIVADINEEATKDAASKYNATVVSTDQIMEIKCDVFAPCALGGILNDDSIPNLRCKIVAGGANNQLLKCEHADLLRDRQILYAPDFVINAGGLIFVTTEISEEGFDPTLSRNNLYSIYERLTAIYEIAEKNDISTHAAALSLAEYRINYNVGKREKPPVFH